jgi:hypothetical protein
MTESITLVDLAPLKVVAVRRRVLRRELGAYLGLPEAAERELRPDVVWPAG